MHHPISGKAWLPYDLKGFRHNGIPCYCKSCGWHEEAPFESDHPILAFLNTCSDSFELANPIWLGIVFSLATIRSWTEFAEMCYYCIKRL